MTKTYRDPVKRSASEAGRRHGGGTVRDRRAPHPHEAEELEFGRGPRLWDADPEVCCAAFQLGACAHTEGGEPYEDEREAEAEVRYPAWLEADADGVVPDDEPF